MNEAPRFVDLRCGTQVVRVDASLCEMATERVFWRAFLVDAEVSGAPPSARVLDETSDVARRDSAGTRGVATSAHAPDSGASPALIVERALVPAGTLIQAPLGECRFELSAGRLRVQVEDGVSRGELVLRLAYYLCAVEQGAVLIHACALRRGDVALVASGKSGDGKSTLSRLGVAAGLELLTDEVVMLFPDGRVCGTPFRSDFVHAGTPGLARARYFLALSKQPYEALEPLAALTAAQLATSQCFELPEVALPRAEARRRLLAFLAHVEPRTLAFRKDPAAGEFVRAALGDPEMTTVTRL